MSRHLATVALIVCLFPASLYADTAEFTISSASANVHKAPTTASPVIGRTSRGQVLPVKRELGSWVRIPWPTGDEGVGYVHVSMGWIAHISTPSSQSGAVTTTAQRAKESSPSSSSARGSSSIAPVRQPVASAAAPADPVSHIAGIGLSMGNSSLGFGVSGRATVHDRFGVQLQVSRYAPSTVVGQPHLTSFQVAPSFLYALPDKLTDYVWMRPYVGAGMIAYRSTVSMVDAPAAESVKDSHWGQQLFGGVELAIASMPRFGLSVDYGYRWSDDTLNQFDFGGPALSMSGHWYVK